MKNGKRIAALLGVVALLIIFCLPMFFALKGDFSQGAFMASLYTVLFVAVMGYVIWMVFRLVNKKKNEGDKRMIKNIVFDVGLVLVEFNWQSYLDSFHFDKEKRDKIAKATFQSEVWDERDKGLLEEEDYIRKFQALAPEYADDIRTVIERSTECIVRDGLCRDLDKISQGAGIQSLHPFQLQQIYAGWHKAEQRCRS